MACINAKDEEEKRRRLTPEVRNYIVRDLVTTMFSYTLKPSKEFCTIVAKSLVQKHKFMKDVGANVSGYVSVCIDDCNEARTDVSPLSKHLVNT